MTALLLWITPSGNGHVVGLIVPLFLMGTSIKVYSSFDGHTWDISASSGARKLRNIDIKAEAINDLTLRRVTRYFDLRYRLKGLYFLKFSRVVDKRPVSWCSLVFLHFNIISEKGRFFG